jgi:hypothetical protein
VFISFFIMPMLINVSDWLIRYFSPILVATLPAVFVLISGHFSFSGKRNLSKLVPVWTMGLLFLQTLVLYLHLDLTVARYQRALLSNSLLTFQFLRKEKPSAAYVSLNKKALSGQAKNNIQYEQYKLNADSTVLAWVSHPFHLDYKRNKILTIDAGGLGVSDIPFTEGVEKLRSYFLGLGVDYILWQYRGPGVRGSAMLQNMINRVNATEGGYIQPELDLRLKLELLVNKSKIIRNTGRIVSFDIRK